MLMEVNESGMLASFARRVAVQEFPISVAKSVHQGRFGLRRSGIFVEEKFVPVFTL
jgi:hypothetical protein